MKKLICLLTVLLLLSGCGAKDPSPVQPQDGSKYSSYTGADFLRDLKAFVPGEKNADEKEDDPGFEEYLDGLFKDMVATDYLTMHYTVIDYKKYGIEKPEVTIGPLDYEDTSEVNEYADILEELESFDYSTLSKRQQYDYDALFYSMLESACYSSFGKYELLFSSGTDLASTLITNFSEYVFYDQESLDDYMILLEDIDRYLDDALAYTHKQADNGVYTTDYGLNYSIDYINGFLSLQEHNELITGFVDRIDGLDFLDDAQKEDYKERNKEIVLKEVLPAFEKTVNELKGFLGKVKNPADMALYNIDKDYAEFVYLLNGSDNQPIDVVFENIKDTFDYQVATYFTAAYDGAALAEYLAMDEASLPEGMKQESGKDYLEYLRTHLTVSYPDLGETDYKVSELNPSTASDTILAYYLSCPIDDLNQNTIRTNPNTLSDDPIETYSTLSHEGFPGHLYQNIYYQKTGPHPFRSMMSFIGYTEGYAVKAQEDAMHFAGFISEKTGDLFFFDNNYYFTLYSVIDIGINCFGWKEQDIAKYLSETQLFGTEEEMMADAPFYLEFFVDLPGTYCSYGLGFANMTNLRDYAMEQLSDNFDLTEYNETILKNGPLPYVVLRSAIDDYCGK